LRIERRLLRRKVFDQYDELATAASLMESGGYVNAGKLKCLSIYKSLN